MTLVRIVVDGETIVDKDIGAWTQSLPELEKYVKPNGEAVRPEPHMQALLVLLSTALMKREAFVADVVTNDDGWTSVRIKNPTPNPLIMAPKKSKKPKKSKV